MDEKTFYSLVRDRKLVEPDGIFKKTVQFLITSSEVSGRDFGAATDKKNVVGKIRIASKITEFNNTVVLFLKDYQNIEETRLRYQSYLTFHYSEVECVGYGDVVTKDIVDIVELKPCRFSYNKNEMDFIFKGEKHVD